MIEARRRRLSVPNDDTAAKGSPIAEDPVIGDFQVIAPAMDENTTAALGTVGEADAVDSRWVTEIVGRVELGCGVAVPQPVVVTVVRRCASVGVEVDAAALSRVRGAAVGSIVVLDAFRKSSNCRAFVGSHKRGFLQQLQNIPVEAGSPADNGFQGYRIHPALHCSGTRELT